MEKEVERFLYDGNGGNEYSLHCWQERIHEFLMKTSSQLTAFFDGLAVVDTLLPELLAGQLELAGNQWNGSRRLSVP